CDRRAREGGGEQGRSGPGRRRARRRQPPAAGGEQRAHEAGRRRGRRRAEGRAALRAAGRVARAPREPRVGRQEEGEPGDQGALAAGAGEAPVAVRGRAAPAARPLPRLVDSSGRPRPRIVPAMRLASAPCTWGVWERTVDRDDLIPPDRMLAAVRELGYEGIELGPPGYLGDSAAAVAAAL